MAKPADDGTLDEGTHELAPLHMTVLLTKAHMKFQHYTLTYTPTVTTYELEPLIVCERALVRVCACVCVMMRCDTQTGTTILHTVCNSVAHRFVYLRVELHYVQLIGFLLYMLLTQSLVRLAVPPALPDSRARTSSSLHVQSSLY